VTGQAEGEVSNLSVYELRIEIDESFLDAARQKASDLLYRLETDGLLPPPAASGARLFAIEAGETTEVGLSPPE
jgi:hypothetical protein